MAATKEFGKAQFRYDEANDGYICPQGHLLKAYNSRKENAKYQGHKRYQNFAACAGCRVKDKCSDSEKGRTIQDRPFQRYADEVDKRTNEFVICIKSASSLSNNPLAQ